MAEEAIVAAQATVTTKVGVDRIKELLPHRGDNLLLDAAEISGQTIKAWYLVTGEECWMQGHFPGNPILMGVMMLEFAAQACGVLASELYPDQEGALGMLSRTDQVKWGRIVRPGDVLSVTAVFDKKKLGSFRFRDVIVLVNNEINGKPALACDYLYLGVANAKVTKEE